MSLAQHGSGIAPEVVQEVLESAQNAAQKGLSQFHTPTWFGKLLASAMPDVRPVVTDLMCGNGQLANACANPSTQLILGCDLDPCKFAPMKGQELKLERNKVCADLTKFYQLLKDVDCEFDFFALNPGWDLHLHRERLSALSESSLEAVKNAFEALDPRLSSSTIDSTVATLCIALDRCTEYGEGFLIGNEATIQRLVLGMGAPHKPLSIHVWAHLSILGNPMTGIQDCAWQEGQQFRTGVIYFSPYHTDGIAFERLDLQGDEQNGGSLQVAIDELKAARRNIRAYHSIRSDWQCQSTTTWDRWKAASEEWKQRNQKQRSDWNLWLDHKGAICVNLSLYDKHSGKIDKNAAQDLFELQGKRPMQLVLLKAQRNALEKAVLDSPWRVAPAVQDAVRTAISDYHKERAPLYPLPKIQRIAYLDDEDTVKCDKDLGTAFKAGKAYPLETRTYKVNRTAEKLNLQGEREVVELGGSELFFFITGEDGKQYVFAEAYLRGNEKITIERLWEQIDYTLGDLVEHFEIPEVPDVATLQPEAYARNKDLLMKIFEALNS